MTRITARFVRPLPELPIYVSGLSIAMIDQTDIDYINKIFSMRREVISRLLSMFGELYLLSSPPLLLLVEKERIEKEIVDGKEVDVVDVSRPMLDLVSLNYVVFRSINLEVNYYSKNVKYTCNISEVVNRVLQYLNKLITILVDDEYGENRYHIVPTTMLFTFSPTAVLRPILKVRSEDELSRRDVRERLLRELDLLIKNVVGIVKRKYRSIIRFFKVKIPPMTLEYDSHDCKILIDPSKETADVIIKNSARTVFLFPINGREISFCAEKYFQAILPLSYRLMREIYRRKMVKFINIHKSFALIDTFHVYEGIFYPREFCSEMIDPLLERLKRFGIDAEPLEDGIFCEGIKVPSKTLIIAVVKSEVDDEDVRNLVKLFNIDARFIIYYAHLKTAEIFYSKRNVKYVRFRSLYS